MNAPETTIASGLRSSEGAPIPLRGVDVQGDVIGGSARVRVRQRYENQEQKPIEAIYTFPLPSEATLVGFFMESGERRIEGVAKEREAAFRAYDDALLEGHGAALLDQERPNVFTASVGNLLPGETTIVEVEYVQRLHADEGALRVMIPTLVAPRYIPGNPAGDRSGHGGADPTDRVPDADRISPKIGAADYTVSLELALHVGASAQVASPSHAITVIRDGEVARVSFSKGREPLDRDVVLTVEAAEGQALGGVVAHRKGTDPGAFVLSRVVDLFDPNKAKAPLDVVFLLDRSGSMGGSSIEEARKALRLCLRQLREGDRFSIVAFDDREEHFAPQPVPFTQKTLEQADRWIASVDARGGTELLQPLVSAVERAPDGVVVLLTDGQVGNEDEILAAVMQKRRSTRIYAFGIGTNVSDALLSQLAKRTSGALEGIHPGERIDEKVVAVFARAIARRVRDVKVKFTADGQDLEVDELAPVELPDLVDGEAWSLFGRYRKPGRGKAEIRGTLDGAPFLVEVPVELPESADAPSVPKLWASERIRDFEAMELQIARAPEGRRAKAMKDRIVALATEFGIASRYTSFVVVETRTGDRRVREQAEARPIPVHAPAGWAMVQPQKSTLTGGGAAYFTRAGAVAPAPAFAPPGAPPPPPAAGAPMRPMAAAPATFAPPPAPRSAAYDAAEQPKYKKRSAGLLERAKMAVGSMFDRGAADEESDDAASYELSAPMPEPQAKQAEGGDPAFAILSTQLASGLWEGDASQKDEDLRRVRATTDALAKLLALHIDTTHALHGELVRKAVEALAPLAAAIAGKHRVDAEKALAIAWLAGTGKRTRQLVRAAIQKASLRELETKLADETALRAATLG